MEQCRTTVAKNLIFLCLVITGIFLSCKTFSNELSSISLVQRMQIKKLKNGKMSEMPRFNRQPTYPWKGDLQCERFSVQLAEKDSLIKWPLTSFPGSGVTWTRQMIEGITGFYTGSVYYSDPSPTLNRDGNVTDNTDDPLCGCTILDKDHEATVQVGKQGLDAYFELLHRLGHAGIVHQQYDRRGVLLLRNPMDVIFSFRNWQLAGKTGNASPDAFKGPEWEEIIDYVAYAWADHAIRWIEQIDQGTVLFYERLLGKTAENELRRLLNIIGFKPIDSDRMKCALSHRNRTDHKRHIKNKMLLEPKHRIKLMKSIHQVQQSLRRKGWPTLPIYLYDVHSPDGKI
ncbi:sialate:O-sulfotransferase 1-like [Daphnia carinata]|uniref:sialate:O-sulfotransferase 1-like n=1 Tax=Daphnia carinata TaxID=120202 RepID=UPI00257A8444|nr:sialate:O-sulfotransferase 1-like [Daphnia carinata]